MAHETTEAAKAEFAKLNSEVVQLRSYATSRALPAQVAPQIEEHSLSASFHSANLDRLLTDVSTATGVGTASGISVKPALTIKGIKVYPALDIGSEKKK